MRNFVFKIEGISRTNGKKTLKTISVMAEPDFAVREAFEQAILDGLTLASLDIRKIAIVS